MTFISSPEPVQMKVWRVLLISGASLSVLVYLVIAFLIVRRPKGERRKTILEAFRNPNWETVSGREFKNESVDLDGKRFVNCTFKHVTLAFHGKGPVEFLTGCNFGSGLILSTDYPPAAHYARLIHIFGSLPNTVAKHVDVDKNGKEVPPGFQITEILTSGENTK
jgi:hypothetical protein